MINFDSVYPTNITEPFERQLFFNNLDYENDISFRESLNFCSNNFSNDFNIFSEENKNDLILNEFNLLSSIELPHLNPFEEQNRKKLCFKIDEEHHETNKKNIKSSEKIVIKKKRGRGNINDLKEKSLNIHDKYSADNLLRKLQVHYLSFIISFLNDILKNLNYKKKFLKLDYKFKKNVKQNFVESLKSKSLREIICNNISSKYQNYNDDANEIICTKIQKDEVLNKILSENYLQLFKKIYLKSNKIVNLKEYGLDKEIILSKEVKMYKDLLKSFEENKEYKKSLNECINRNFLTESKFLIY